MSKKAQLIIDIQELLNSHENVSTTKINPSLLEFMDEDTLKNIIGSLLDQKETHVDADMEWLNQFKQEKN